MTVVQAIRRRARRAAAAGPGAGGCRRPGCRRPWTMRWCPRRKRRWTPGATGSGHAGRPARSSQAGSRRPNRGCGSMSRPRPNRGARLSGLLVRDARGGGEVRTILADRARWTGAGGRPAAGSGLDPGRPARPRPGAPRAPSTVRFRRVTSLRSRRRCRCGGPAYRRGPGRCGWAPCARPLAEARRAAAAPDDPLVRRLSAGGTSAAGRRLCCRSPSR